MLGILLYITTGKPVGEGVIAFTCGLILAANAALLYLLDRMERAIETKENLLALGQQLQLQAKNMEAASVTRSTISEHTSTRSKAFC